MRELQETGLPRIQQLALILLLGLAAAPHAFNLAPLVSAFFAFILVLRLVIYANQWRLPGRLIKAVLTLLGIAVVLASYHGVAGQKGGVALLLVMVGLKLLEVRARRDLYITVFLTFFLMITQFLYDQSFLIALYMLALAVGLVALMIEMNRVAASASWWQPLRGAGVLLLQALPMMVILFVLFPRLSSPLWQLQLSDPVGVTGLSGSMSPGSISELSQSGAVAFRAEFEGEPPPRSDLYWRGPVFSETDGRNWTAEMHGAIDDINYRPVGEPVRHTVTLEPSGQRWLLMLDRPGMTPVQRAKMTPDYQILANREINSRIQYQAVSYTQYEPGAIMETQRRKNLELPPTITPRMQALANGWVQAAAEPMDVVRAALAHFNARNFIYTLSPPLLRQNPADEFLFETRSGFCEHFASSFVLLMRAAGIPARVVAGYQGGELNPVGGYFVVRQSSAHAWAEVLLEGRGWMRVDPTAAVAPDRVESPIEFGDARNLGDPITFQTDADLSSLGRIGRDLKFYLDALGAAWNDWVLQYDKGSQAELLARLGLDFLKRQGMAVLMILLVAALTLGVGFYLVRQSRLRPDPVKKSYDRFCKRLAEKGVRRRGNEGPRDYGVRAERALPSLAETIRAITERYIGLRYGARAPSQDVEQAFHRSVRDFRP